MFAHIFTTRLKCIFRDRQNIFWALLFPIALATLFHFAFSGLSKDYAFQKFNIAVVNNAAFQKDTSLKSTLNSVSGKDTSSSHKQLFDITYCDKEKADSLLRDSKVDGYIVYGTEPTIVVKDSGFNQSILKSFLDEYKQRKDCIMTILKTNPAAAATVLSDTSDSTQYLKTVSLTNSKPDQTLNYFYALIAMACLFGGSFGLTEVSAVQANQSPQAARINLAPIHKLKVFLSSICAATVVQTVIASLLVTFLHFVLNIDFGTKVPFILLAIIISSFTSVSFGAFIGAVLKTSENFKGSVLISVTMIMSFLAGLMVVNMKYLVQVYAPVLATLNPANIITDLFYSLYYYDTMNRFFTDSLILLGFSAVFYTGVFLVMRRQRYESI